jgi:hypothetical protein
MGRPRGFDVEEVVAAAADLFWECGYQRVTLVDLERATCLNRSSLYQAFGAKDELFGEALALYIDSFIAPVWRQWSGRVPDLATSSASSAGWRGSFATIPTGEDAAACGSTQSPNSPTEGCSSMYALTDIGTGCGQHSPTPCQRKPATPSPIQS